MTSITRKKVGSTVHPTLPDLVHERSVGAPEVLVAGVDEVGRGCIAGPVVAATVILPGSAFDSNTAPTWLSEVRDSKLLTSLQRERLDQEIRNYALAWSIAEASVEEIDSINILRASHLAMGRAVRTLKILPDFVWVDGNLLPRPEVLPFPAKPLVKGDQKSISIACASILAKVYRDALMDRLDKESPGYGLSKHKGYGTPAHKKALESLGVASFHRKTFAPVRDHLS